MECHYTDTTSVIHKTGHPHHITRKPGQLASPEPHALGEFVLLLAIRLFNHNHEFIQFIVVYYYESGKSYLIIRNNKNCYECLNVLPLYVDMWINNK